MGIKNYLKNLNIPFKEHSHKAVFNIAESTAEGLHEKFKGPHCKSLFIKSRDAKQFYLVIMPGDKRLDMESLGKLLGKKIKFANESELKEILNLTPGSVSPFGLINDSENKVHLILDKQAIGQEYMHFHPNINTETLELKTPDFQKYLKSLKNKITLLDL